MHPNERLPQSESEWLERVRTRVLDSDVAGSETLLVQAIAKYPHSIELLRAMAAVYNQTGRDSQAERVLAELLKQQPGDAASAFLLAHILASQGRIHALGEVLETAISCNLHDVAIVLEGIKQLNEFGLKQDAAKTAEAAIAAGTTDPRIYVYSGMLAMQLGQFDLARQRYLFVLENSPQACEWHVPNGLAHAQRYRDGSHPDFMRFRSCLQQAGLSNAARSTLLFALGKAHDDIGEYELATGYFREGNTVAHRFTKWSHEQWRKSIEARLSARLHSEPREPGKDFVPVFIVGMPRSGSTLIAELLARHPQVCNRGELSGLQLLAQQFFLHGAFDSGALEHIKATYTSYIRQDDSDARWFIDKHPLNFCNVELILALWPNAKIIHATRNARDTALSIWMQSFVDDAMGFACDFTDIAMVMNDCRRLMARACKQYPHAIRTIRYEDVVNDPKQTIESVSEWLGLPKNSQETKADAGSAISTSSVWQARQPVYTRAVGRWHYYSNHVSELVRFPASES